MTIQERTSLIMIDGYQALRVNFYKTDCQYSTESNKVYMIFRIHQVHFGIPVGIFEPVMEKG